MRIAYVSPYSWSHPGGVNSHIKGLAREMLERGHSVCVIAPRGKSGSCDLEVIDAGFTIPFPSNASIARISISPLAPLRVRNALRRGFDVVHVHEPLVPLVSVSAVLSSDSKVVGTFHAARGGSDFTYRVAKTFLKRVHKRLGCLIAVSEAARDYASDFFPGEYLIIPNGVNTRIFKPSREKPEGYPAGKTVLFVGRNEKRKGVEILINAFRIVTGEVDCSLVIVGPGFGSEFLRKLDSTLRRRVFLFGEVKNEELPKFFSAAQVVCAPALGAESFGIVLVEAMACGTPVVASNIPGYTAVVEKTGGGITFKSGDSADLANVLIQILSDESMRLSLSEKAIKGAGLYSWKTIADKIEACYMG